MSSSSSPRILITRLSAIGDCIHTVPIVSALRRHLPDAHVAWITQGGPATLLADYPGLDDIIVVPRDWMKSLSSIREIRRELRAHQFDISIDPQSLTKSALLGWLSGARQRIGFSRPQGREASLLLNNVRITPQKDHVVECYLELLQPLLGNQTLEPTFELRTPASEKVDTFLRETHLTNGFAVINPGAGWDSKLWVPSRFGRVAKYLGETYQLPTVVVWAGEREVIWAKEIVASSGGHAWLAPDTSLPELGTLLSKSALCVAADTGPLHLAAAVGTPCVGLYGTTLPRVCGPYGAQHVSVQTYYHAGSSRERRSVTNIAMRAIEVATVCNACDQALKATEFYQRAA